MTGQVRRHKPDRKKNMFVIKHKKLIFAFSVFLFLICLPCLAAVVTPGSTGLEETAGAAGLPKTSLTSIVGNIIRALMAALGLIFFILVIYGGILWMTAAGNDEKITKAKTLLTSAVIGLLIVLSAYAIASYVVDVLVSGPPEVTPD